MESESSSAINCTEAVAEPATKYRFMGRVPVEWKLEALRHVWEVGDTAQSLADKLAKLCDETVTRACVVGFYHRYRKYLERNPLLRTRSPRRPRRAPQEPRQEARAAPSPRKTFFVPTRRPEDLQAPSDKDHDSKRIRLADLEPCQCRWPTHEDLSGHQFCGHQTAFGASYCDKHEVRQWDRKPRTPRAGGFYQNMNKPIQEKEDAET